MASPQRFQLPTDGRTYIEQIVERCRSLIQYGVCGDMHPSQLRKWMKNFTSEEERYFAACILDSLIYRSKAQTIALIRQLFERTLPDLTRLDVSPLGHLENWRERLMTNPRAGDPQIRLVAAVSRDAPPTKSAYIIARYIMQDLRIPSRWIINPWEMDSEIKRGVNLFVFIDDFLGTGDQFTTTATKEKIGQYLANSYVVYAPLAAHSKGISELQKRFGELRVCSVEQLDETYGLFHVTSTAFDDQTNTPEAAKSFYYELLKTKGINIHRPHRKGYGSLELAYSFEHATPDNSLPIFWWRDSPWQPLFEHRV